MCMSGKHISSLVSVGLLLSVLLLLLLLIAARESFMPPSRLPAASLSIRTPPSLHHPPPTRLCLSSSPSRLPPPVSCPFKLSRDLKRKKQRGKKGCSILVKSLFFLPPTFLFMLLIYFFLYPTLTLLQSIFISFYIPGTHGCKYKINLDSFVLPFVKFICLWHVKKNSHAKLPLVPLWPLNSTWRKTLSTKQTMCFNLVFYQNIRLKWVCVKA